MHLSAKSVICKIRKREAWRRGSYRKLYTEDLLRKRPASVDPWIMKEKKAGQIKVSDLRDKYEDMIKNERVRYKFCTPKELDGISLSFSDMLTFDQFMGY